MENNRDFDIFLGVDGVPGPKSLMYEDADGKIRSISGGTYKALLTGQKISLMASANFANSDFFIQTGFRAYIDRKL